MKKLLNIIIVLILVIVAIKLFIWFIPILLLVLLVSGFAIWGYSKYKIYKFKKNIESEGKFDFTKKESYEKTQQETKKEDNFNGTVIDVDYEDITKE